jgi:hypothetical protein
MALLLALPPAYGQETAAPRLNPSEIGRRVERIDTDCRLSTSARVERIAFVRRQMRIWNGEIQSLNDQAHNAIDQNFWYSWGYDGSNIGMIVAASAGVVAAVDIIAQAAFGYGLTLIGSSGGPVIQVIPHAAMGLGTGQAVMTSGVTIGGFTLPSGTILSGAGLYSTLISRIGMVALDIYHLLSPSRSFAQDIDDVHSAAAEEVRREPYLNSAAVAFLSDPTFVPGENLSSRGLARMPMDNHMINEGLDRLLRFGDRMEDEIGHSDGLTGNLTEFWTRREGAQAALRVAVLQNQMTLMNFKMRYWGDLLRILRLDRDGCR